MLTFLTFVTSLAIAGVAAWYSIAGLAAIFAAAKIPIIIMGSVLEAGKLVTASWLYRNWKVSPFLLKSYLTVAVIVLMFITSMGIFGYLSKAHIDQTITVGDNSIQIEQIDIKINRQQKRIDDADMVISQLDEAVNTLIEYDRIRGETGAIATRESQKEERDNLNNIIDDASNIISELQVEKALLSKEQIQIEAEVGPIKYIAELIYGESTTRDILEEAVRFVILTIIFVFDPLAVLLLIAANMSLTQRKPMTNKMIVPSFEIKEDRFDVVDAEIDVNLEDIPIVDLDLQQIRKLIEQYESNPKSKKPGTFVHNKLWKLKKREKDLLEKHDKV